MTLSTSPLMPDQVVECISTGRDPTLQELFEVAERMWTDGAAGRSAFGWGRLPPDSSDRLTALHGAQLALSGDGDPVLCPRCEGSCHVEG